MKNYSLSCCCVGFFLLLLMCQAKGAHLRLPAHLIYQNRPLDPLCLLEASNRKKEVELEQCENQINNKHDTKHYNPLFISKGYLGYDYKTEQPAGEEEGYGYFKPLEQIGNSTLFLMYHNGGGTGQFSFIGRLYRYEDKIKVINVAGGDRCNSGILHADVVRNSSGHYLRYQVNLTPYAMLHLVVQDESDLKRIDHLKDCAICCIAKATFQSPIGQEISQKKLVSVHLLPKARAFEDVADPAQQTCFDKLIEPFYKNHHLRISPKELKLLFNAFKNDCQNNRLHG